MLGGMDALGHTIVTSTPLDRMSKDFRAMVLKNSWVNISSETDSLVSGVEARLKILTSGEPIEDSYKNKDPITFVSRAKAIINCNTFPRFSDRSKGLERRCLFIKFPVNFTEDPQGENDKKRDPDLVANIVNNPEEMAGVLNWALQGLFRILANKGFTVTQSQKDLMVEFMRYNNPLIDFIDETQEKLFEEDGNGQVIKRTTLYKIFKEWCLDNGEEICSARHFYHLFTNTLSGLSSHARLHKNENTNELYYSLGRKPSILNAA